MRSMRCQLVLTAVLLQLLVLWVNPTMARNKKNCGLTCYRWKKCLGQLDGSSRPGQLGDTGIIVLDRCYQEGCDCEELLTTTTTTTTAVPTTASRYSGSLNSGFRGSNVFSRTRTNIRVPRRQEPEVFPVVEQVQDVEQKVLSPVSGGRTRNLSLRSRYSRRTSSRNSEVVITTTESAVEAAADSSKKSSSLPTRSLFGSSKWRGQLTKWRMARRL